MGNAPIPSADPTILLWFLFWGGMAITAVFAFILFYHWLRYGYMYPLVWVMMPIYAVGVLVFIGAMLSGIASL